MTSRKLFVTLLGFWLLLLIPMHTHGETSWISYPSKSDVDPFKDWTVNFNVEIDPSTIHSKDVYARTVSGQKLFLASFVNPDGKSITVLAPPDGYEPGQTYSLFISSEIKSDKGVPMDKGRRMTFSIKNIKTVVDEVSEGVISIGTVTTNRLNVRTGKTTSSELLGQVTLGDKVEIYSIDGFWTEIRFNGKKAFLHKDYLKLRKVNGGILEDQLIVIDAGHGDQDPGAVFDQGREKDINLDVALRVKENLIKLGATPILTREDDTFLPLNGGGSRVEYTKENYGDLFVSIHANASLNPGAHGAETYYDKLKDDNVYEGFLLASKIQEQMLGFLDLYDRGVKSNNFSVIHYNTVPSVLVELGFLTNVNDYMILMSPGYRQVYADAITQGIVNYYKE